MASGFFDLLQQFEQYLRVERNLSDRTRNAYLYDLGRLHEFLILLHGRSPRLDQISADALREYLNYLQVERGLKSTTLARVISSMKHFFAFAVERAVLEASPAATLRNPKQPKKLPVYLVKQELVRLLESPDPKSRFRLRDRCLLATMAFTGLRLSELVGLNVDDVDLINRHMRVMGKGRKERILPLNEVVLGALNDYLNVRGIADSPALFLNRFGRRLSGRMVEKIVDKCLKRAGIFKNGASPHKLRHTFATLLHANDVDLIEIKELMGHANIQSTQIYTHTSNSRLRSAVKKIEDLG